MSQPRMYLLSCGDELLFGHTVDTNAAWLASKCSQLGWRVIAHKTVGDVQKDITEALLEAVKIADAVILTGGLGPTEDDRTRLSLAKALNCPLEERPELVSAIKDRFKSFKREMKDINLVQAQIPTLAKSIPNENGTAPGIHAKLEGKDVFVTPGVPMEMRLMFDNYIKQELNKTPSDSYEILKKLHLIGLGESSIAESLLGMMQESRNPEIGTTVSDSIVTIRMYSKASSKLEATRLIQESEKVIRNKLGDYIFSEDDVSLASTVVELLKSKGAKLAVAESCTGGLLSSTLISVPGVSDVFYEGLVTYDNSSKTHTLGVDHDLLESHGAVSKESAISMSENLAKRLQPYLSAPFYTLSTTGIAGPGGGSKDKPVGTVWISCSSVTQNNNIITRAFQQHMLADRQSIRLRTTNHALEFLRRTLLNMDYPWETVS